jgi:uncharacterized membrane protein
MRPNEFTNALDDERIVAAIRRVEALSRGEVRVHVAEHEVTDPQAEAAVAFVRLGMTRTEGRNGVLIFVAPESQRIAVIGDRDVHARCGEAFWTEVADSIGEEFRAGRFTDGIVAAVARVGEALARYYPRRPDDADRNELPDAVSRG